MTLDELKALPKIELHCHLDGSLSREYLEERLGRTVTVQEMSVSEDCQSLVEYLEKFDLPCSCIKDPEGLEKAGKDILKTMHRENVIYAEIRFAPLLSVTDSFDANQVVEALLRGLEIGKRLYGVSWQVILCLMRHHTFEQNLAVIDLAKRFLGKGVCAIDLAGAESLYPMQEFLTLFEYARDKGIPFTVHAGECGNIQNILDSVEVGARRIGHGIAMRGDQSVQQLVKSDKIGIEMCPISNLQTKSVKDTTEYPLRKFLDKDLLVTINTDNRTVSNTSLTKELHFIQKTYGITDEEIYRMMRNAAETAFVDDTMREKLRKCLK